MIHRGKDECAILLTGRFGSSAREMILIETSTPEIVNAGLPLYSMWEFYPGHGILPVLFPGRSPVEPGPEATVLLNGGKIGMLAVE